MGALNLLKEILFKLKLKKVLNIPGSELEKQISWEDIEVTTNGPWRFVVKGKKPRIIFKRLSKLSGKGTFLMKLTVRFSTQIDKIKLLIDEEPVYLTLNPFGRYEGFLKLKGKPRSVLIELPERKGLGFSIERLVIKRFSVQRNINIRDVDTYIGNLDKVEGSVVYGWAFNEQNPEERVEVTVLIDGSIVAEGIADVFREDLKQAGIGDGRHGFEIKLPYNPFIKGDHELRVIIKKTGKDLNNSPMKVKDPYYNWIEKYEKPFLEKN